MSTETAPNPVVPERAARAWPPQQGDWTYEDYARLPDNGMRYEVIRGNLYMAPAPSTMHQHVLAALFGRMWAHIQELGLGAVLFSPIDVILPDLANPVQPDILFVSAERLDIIEKPYVIGAPDLIVEALSPSSHIHDRRRKYALYSEAGVREYWIIDPEARVIEVHVLRGKAYAMAGRHSGNEPVHSEVLPDLVFEAASVFAEGTSSPGPAANRP